MSTEIEDVKKYYDNGQLYKHCFYRYDKYDGEYKEWYDNGQLSKHGFYRGGKWEGEWKEWYVSGKKLIHGFYNNNKLNGEHKVWYFNGQLLEHSLYCYGEEICNLTDDILGAITKLQRVYRIHRALSKYFSSRSFIEQWYSPTVKGGLLAKQNILEVFTST